MTQPQRPEVFTVDELARATAVTVEHLDALISSGQLRLIPGTRFIAASEAIRVGRRLRRAAPPMRLAQPALFDPAHSALARRRPVGPAFSTLLHGAIVGLAFLLSVGDVDTASTDAVPERARLVFIAMPGPGGGGGGGGLRNPLPASKIQRKTAAPRKAVTVPAVTPRPVVTTPRPVEPPKRPAPQAAPVVEPKPSQREPDPAPANVLVAPVAEAAADPRDRAGVIEAGRGDAESQGAGSGGGAGSGQGTGNGAGVGAGIGDGIGGGTGGGPYRPGSGIEPPRLLREVKADYTEEARRRGVSGDVVLEIVVRRDGSVGGVRVRQGLGAGLDQRAIAAVRQWRFEPARRQGTPVDVLVEVAVEFILR